jgi:glycosyltransferase involved in cell wall biosynthesis
MVARASDRPHVTVSIPVHGGREFLAQAVHSILDQTHANLTLVVVNDADPADPWAAIEDIDDPRLVRFDLGSHRGRYYADEVVLRATTSAYFAVQDADDWSSPDRIERSVGELQRCDADAVVSPIHVVDSRRGTVSEYVFDLERLSTPPGPRLRHRVNHHALFDVDRLRRFGGFYSGFDVAYDSFLMSILELFGRLAVVDRILYHRRRRPGSLTTRHETGYDSEERASVLRVLSDIYAALFDLAAWWRVGRVDDEELLGELGALLDRSVPPRAEQDLDADAARLAAVLAPMEALRP